MPNPTPVNSELIGQPGSRWEILTPALILDLDVLDANIATMAAWAREGGFTLRPHGKSHKSPDIAKRQVAAGAVGLCCASLREAQVMAANGIPGLLITTPLAPGKAPLVAALVKDGADVSVVADHEDLVAAYGAAAEAAGIPASKIGETGGDFLTFAGESAAIEDLAAIFEAWLPDYMGAA